MAVSISKIYLPFLSPVSWYGWTHKQVDFNASFRGRRRRMKQHFYWFGK